MKLPSIVLGYVLAIGLASAQAPADAEAEAAWQAWSETVMQDMAAGADPRAWALVAVGGAHGRTGAIDHAAAEALLRQALIEAPDDALVQWLATQHFSAEGQAAPAAEHAAALARVEPDNAANWLPTLTLAAHAGDTAAIDAALAHMAAATRHDTHFAEVLRLWMDAYAQVPAPAATATGLSPEATVFTAAMARALAMAIPGYRPLLAACRPTPDAPLPVQRAGQCAAIGRLLLRQGTTRVDRGIGVALLRHADEDERTAADDAIMRRLAWQLQQAPALGLDASDVALRAYAADWRRLDDELAVYTRALARAGLPTDPPPNWMPPRGWDAP